MTDGTTAPADATAMPETPEAAAARVASVIAGLHAEAIAGLQQDHDATLRKLDVLKLQLEASFAKAKAEASHVAYANSFVRDVGLKADEILAWMKRHV